MKLGQQAYNIRLGEFAMSDGTSQVEGRIEKVKIIGREDILSEDDTVTTKYFYKIGEGFFSSVKEVLFSTELEAEIELQNKIDSISIQRKY